MQGAELFCHLCKPMSMILSQFHSSLIHIALSSKISDAVFHFLTFHLCDHFSHCSITKFCIHFFSPHICYKYLTHPSFLDFTTITVELTASASLCVIQIYSKHFIPLQYKYFHKLVVFQRLQCMSFP
jgi:hypothetical protein